MGGDFGERPLADDTLRMRRARAHNEIMARNVALLQRLGRATRPALADARRDLQVGDTLTLYADFDVTCSSAGQVRAVVRMVGNSSIWLDDLDNPAADLRGHRVGEPGFLLFGQQSRMFMTTTLEGCQMWTATVASWC